MDDEGVKGDGGPTPIRADVKPDDSELGAVHRIAARVEVDLAEMADQLDQLTIVLCLIGIGICLLAVATTFHDGPPS